MTKPFFLLLLTTLLCVGCSTTKSSDTNQILPNDSVVLIGEDYHGIIPDDTQRQAALGVINRLLGEEIAHQFKVEILPSATDGKDFFEIESLDGKIVLRGTNGVSACRGLKWYLNNLCHCSVSWRGDNLNLPSPLPLDFAPHRESTPFQYRYIFNNCIYGYSMAWWQWDDWERMLDVLAFNGVNMPAMLLGQEKIWQETYQELGYSKEDLDNYFAGPAWYPWQWMGNLDGWGGPLPQSVIDGQCELQKKILSRSRSLGMKTVLPGFSGHIPKCVVDRNPDLKHGTMEWWGFGPTYMLDWEDPMFKKISTVFMTKQREIYGTDHYYNIDPFNEMTPPSTETEYLTNMSRMIFSCIDESDPEGIWVLMTWFAKIPVNNFWNPERTQAFFDAVPDDRVLALELYGENWSGTGWYRQGGWYNKPWVWSILQNFGNRVDIYGSLPNIFENYNKVKNSPDKGNLQGMGIMTEGIGYNPVVYEMVFDMMWGEGITDFEQWKNFYVKKRYGTVSEPLENAWETLYKTRYLKQNLTGISPLIFPPALHQGFELDMQIVEVWKELLAAAPEQKDNEAYLYDLTNVGREALAGFSPYYTMQIKKAMDAWDMEALKAANQAMLQYIQDVDRLTGTNEHLMVGKWLDDARSWGSTPEEKMLMEWGAKRQITDWGGQIGRYAVKEWSGIIGDRQLPAWRHYLSEIEKDIGAGYKFNKKYATDTSQNILNSWPDRHSYLPVKPTEDPVAVAQEMFDKYYPVIKGHANSSGYAKVMRNEEVLGLAYKKPVEATGNENKRVPAYAVDGNLRDEYWSAIYPASLTVDLQKPEEVGAFHVFPYRGDGRYYQYTIDISVDGENWMPVVDMGTNTEPSSIDGHYHPFTAGYKFRYARLNVLKNSANPSIHIIEFKVLSPKDVEELMKK